MAPKEMVTINGRMSREDAEEARRLADAGKPVRLTATLRLNAGMSENIEDILDAPDETSMVELLELAGLDPTIDLAHSDLSESKWGECDLSGYDFTGANLAGCDFSRAKVDEAVFTNAIVDGAVWPDGFQPQTAGFRH